MGRLIIITGFASSGTFFAAQIISFVLGKCSKFGDWDVMTDKWNGEYGEELVIIHRTMPSGRNPKKWIDDLENEIALLKDYSREFIICTRDLNISRMSRIKRWGGSHYEYQHDDRRASEIFSQIISKERCFILSLESAFALGDAYYQGLFAWLNVETNFSPKVLNVNKTYIKQRFLSNLIKNSKINIKRLLKNFK